MPLLSPLMQVSLTIKDTMVPGRGARLTTPCKRRNGHTSASRSRSLFQQHNGRSVKCRTTEDTCPRVSCILGVYKSKGLPPIAHSAIPSQTNSSAHLHYILYYYDKTSHTNTRMLWPIIVCTNCSYTHRWWLENEEGSMCNLGSPWHLCDCGTGCRQLCWKTLCMSYLKNATRPHFLRWCLLQCWKNVRKMY